MFITTCIEKHCTRPLNGKAMFLQWQLFSHEMYRISFRSKINTLSQKFQNSWIVSVGGFLKNFEDVLQ